MTLTEYREIVQNLYEQAVYKDCKACGQDEYICGYVKALDEVLEELDIVEDNQ